MMKRLSLVLVVVALAFGSPAYAQSPKLNVATGKLFQPLALPIEQGSVVCRDGAYTGVGFLCSPETTRITVRNWVTGWFATDVTGPAAGYLPSGELIPGVSGPLHFGLNCNLNGRYQGQCWGTFETSVGEGAWIGVWTGEFDLGASPPVAQVSIIARGLRAMAGRVLKLDATGPAKDGDFYFLAEILGR